MGVGAAGDDVEALLDKGGGQGLGIADHGLGIDLEARLQGLAEGGGLGGDGMHQRPALEAREGRGVDLLADVVAVRQDHAAATGAQGLVRGRGDDMGMRQRARVHTGGDQAREMGHVDHEVGAHRVGDLAEAREVEDPRIGRAAADDQLRLVLLGQGLDLVEVDPGIVLAHAVLHGVEPLAREVRRGAMGQVTAGRQRQAEHGVAGPQQGQHDTLVGLGAGVRLHVDEAAAEKLLGALDGEPLDRVDMLAAPIIAAAGIALGVLVGQYRALGLHDGAGDDVLGGDQFDLVLLAQQFVADRRGELGVGFGQGTGEEQVLVDLGRGGVSGTHSFRVLSWRHGLSEPQPSLATRPAWRPPS